MFQISLQYNFFYSEKLVSAFLLEQFCWPQIPLGHLYQYLLTFILKRYTLLNIAFWVDSSFLSFKTFLDVMSVPSGLPIFVDEIFSHLNHDFLTHCLGSLWLPSFSVRLVLVLGLVEDLSSDYII